MTAAIKLTAGKIYDAPALIRVGWSNGQAEHAGEFFDQISGSCYLGRYRGPDAEGVEPLYGPVTRVDLCDSETSEAVRKATVAEMEESLNSGQPEGHIIVDGRRCFVSD